VFNTVRDALKHGYQTVLLLDAIRAVDVHAGAGERAIAEMLQKRRNSRDLQTNPGGFIMTERISLLESW